MGSATSVNPFDGSGAPLKIMKTPYAFFARSKWLAPISLAGFLAACGASAPELPKLSIDQNRVTVSGISSGAYMAQQVHIALSSTISGAGLIAGGPYGCAQGKLDLALNTCMQSSGDGPDVDNLIALTKARADADEIDALAGLRGDKVWNFHGEADSIVAPIVTAKVENFYLGLNPDVRVFSETRPGVGHTFPTRDFGTACDTTATPFLGKCGFDAAGAIFTHVIGVAGNPADNATGDLLTFNQNAFSTEGQDALLADSGYLYVPKVCREKSCGLHLAFHGCQQSIENIGSVFAENAGYNRWADLAEVIVIYPQTRSSLMPLNPKACWDWWGYSGTHYDTRRGAQIAWVNQLLKHFLANP